VWARRSMGVSCPSTSLCVAFDGSSRGIEVSADPAGGVATWTAAPTGIGNTPYHGFPPLHLRKRWVGSAAPRARCAWPRSDRGSRPQPTRAQLGRHGTRTSSMASHALRTTRASRSSSTCTTTGGHARSTPHRRGQAARWPTSRCPETRPRSRGSSGSPPGHHTRVLAAEEDRLHRCVRAPVVGPPGLHHPYGVLQA
jgi:hypothetical protein